MLHLGIRYITSVTDYHMRSVHGVVNQWQWLNEGELCAETLVEEYLAHMKRAAEKSVELRVESVTVFTSTNRVHGITIMNDGSGIDLELLKRAFAAKVFEHMNPKRS